MAKLTTTKASKRNKLVTAPKFKPKSTFRRAPPEESTPHASAKAPTPPPPAPPPYIIDYTVEFNGKSILQGVSTSGDFDFHDFTVKEGRAVEKAADIKGYQVHRHLDTAIISYADKRAHQKKKKKEEETKVTQPILPPATPMAPATLYTFLILSSLPPPNPYYYPGVPGMLSPYYAPLIAPPILPYYPPPPSSGYYQPPIPSLPPRLLSNAQSRSPIAEERQQRNNPVLLESDAGNLLREYFLWQIQRHPSQQTTLEEAYQKLETQLYDLRSIHDFKKDDWSALRILIGLGIRLAKETKLFREHLSTPAPTRSPRRGGAGGARAETRRGMDEEMRGGRVYEKDGYYGKRAEETETADKEEEEEDEVISITDEDEESTSIEGESEEGEEAEQEEE
ncbi:MAG: hypothetical protein Q9187_001339 [Circinaria calcarea]